MNEPIESTLTMIAALVAGDRWLSADACAVYLGMVTKTGEPNRRKFLETVAAQPGFPRPLKLGAARSWKKSEVDDWASEQARRAA